MKKIARFLLIILMALAITYVATYVFHNHNQKQISDVKVNNKTEKTDTSSSTSPTAEVTFDAVDTNNEQPQETIPAANNDNSTTISSEPVSSQPLTELSTKSSSAPIQKLVTVEIQNQGTYTVELQNNDNAFTVLQRAAKENNFSLNYQNYGSLGVMVKGINDIDAHNNYYWAFYYNNQYSQVGASSQPVKDGDITAWKFET